MSAGTEPPTYDEAVDWVRGEVRARAEDGAALVAALDQVTSAVAASIGTASSLGADWSDWSDWSVGGLRRRWVVALVAGAHRGLLDMPETWSGITLTDVAQPGSEELARVLLASAPGPDLVGALVDRALAQPSARAVGVVLCLDPALLATVRPESFTRAVAALATGDGPAGELMAAYDSYVRESTVSTAAVRAGRDSINLTHTISG